MSSFADDLHKFSVLIQTRSQAVLVGVAAEAQNSIVNGSPLTGAPGQPVDTGNLKNSWQLTFPGKGVAEISTNVVYAPIIEDGEISLAGRRGDAGASKGGSRQKLTLRSAVGGFHSVKLTVLGIPKILSKVISDLGGNRA